MNFKRMHVHTHIRPSRHGPSEMPGNDYADGMIEMDMNVGKLIIQPINLGWHWKQFDALFVTGFCIPFGHYINGQKTNHGLGMWTYELEGAVTVYPDRFKLWNIAASAAFELNSKKKNSGIQVGNIATVEGGIGRSFFEEGSMGVFPTRGSIN